MGNLRAIPTINISNKKKTLFHVSLTTPLHLYKNIKIRINYTSAKRDRLQANYNESYLELVKVTGKILEDKSVNY